MDSLARKLSIQRDLLLLTVHDITSPADWRLISAREVRDHGGGGLLSRYNGSVMKAAYFLFPQEGQSNFSISTSQVNKAKGFTLV